MQDYRRNTGSAFTQIGDSIFVVKNSSDTLQNIELWLNGMKVKKIAVSVDPKSLDDHGWASESRERVIDPDLTWYMTGSNIETVFVTGVTYGGAGQAGTVTLSSLTTPGTEGTKMLRSMATNDFGACLLHSKDNKPVSIIDEGFHLFVPDMHDYSVTTTTNPETEETTETVGGKKELTTTEDSKLRAWVEMGVIPATYTDSNGKSWTNYVLSDQYLTPQDDPDGNGNMSDTDAFYRVHPGGAGSYGHNAYLQLETDSVKPAGTTGAAAFNMVFETNGIREAIVNRPGGYLYHQRCEIGRNAYDQRCVYCEQ